MHRTPTGLFVPTPGSVRGYTNVRSLFSRGVAGGVDPENVAPVFDASKHTTVLFDDFSSYANSAALAAAYASSAAWGAIVLDETGLPFPGQTKCYKQAWENSGCDPGGGDSKILIEPYVSGVYSENFVSWVRNWDPDFLFANVPFCTRQGGTKELVHRVGEADGHSTFGQGTVGLNWTLPLIFPNDPGLWWMTFMERPGGQQTFIQHLNLQLAPAQLADGIAHNFIERIVDETSNGAGDGVYQAWIDELPIMNYRGNDPTSPAFGLVQTRSGLGRFQAVQHPGVANGGTSQAQNAYTKHLHFYRVT